MNECKEAQEIKKLPGKKAIISRKKCLRIYVMKVCFIINLDKSNTSLQQMKSSTNLKFTLSQRHSFMGKNKTNFYSSFFSSVCFRGLIKETVHIHTNQKTFVLSITQIPVRTYMETKQQKSRRKRTGQLALQPF